MKKIFKIELKEKNITAKELLSKDIVDFSTLIEYIKNYNLINKKILIYENKAFTLKEIINILHDSENLNTQNFEKILNEIEVENFNFQIKKDDFKISDLQEYTELNSFKPKIINQVFDSNSLEVRNIFKEVKFDTNYIPNKSTISGIFIKSITEDDSIYEKISLFNTHGDEIHFKNENYEGKYGFLQITNNFWKYDLKNEIQSLNDNDDVQEKFIVELNDGTKKEIIISISGTNDNPTIESTNLPTIEDSIINGKVSYLDVDSSVSIKYDNSILGLTINTDGTYRFDSNGYDFLSKDQILSLETILTIIDEQGAQSQNSFIIKLIGTNDIPIIDDIAVLDVHEDSQIETFNFTGSDADINSSFVFSIDENVDGLTFDENGNASFNPTHSSYQYLNEGELKTIVIPVNIIDENSASNSTYLTINILGTNDVPKIEFITQLNINEDNGVVASGQIISNDIDNNAVLTYSTDTSIDGFTLKNDGNYSFDPDFYQHLKDGEILVITIPIKVTDENGAEDSDSLSIQVRGENDIPIIDSISQVNVFEDDSVVNGQITAVDVDTDATYSFSTTASLAGFTLNSDGSYSFDPTISDYQSLNTNDTLVFTIPVTVTDDLGANSTQNLVINLTGTNDYPILTLDSNGATLEDTQTSINYSTSDVDGTVGMTGSALNGTVTINNDGTIDYQPNANYNGADTITVTVTDNSGAIVTRTSTINVQATNDAPTIDNVTSNDVIEQSVDTSTIVGVVTASDNDAGTTLIYTVNDGGNNYVQVDNLGNVTLTQTGVDTINLDTSATDLESFTYTVTVSDGIQSITTSTQTIDISRINDNAPTVVIDTASVDEDSSVSVDVLANDSDLDDTDTLTLDSVSTPTNKGTATIVGQQLLFDTNSDFEYLAAGESEDVDVTYIISDGTLTSTSTATISVTGVNDGPDAAEDTATTNEDTVITILASDLLSNDTDPDTNDTLTLSSVSNPTNGTVSIDGNGDVVFTPTSNFTGTATFDYTISDGNGGSADSSVTLKVTGTNDTPTINTLIQDTKILSYETFENGVDGWNTTSNESSGELTSFLGRLGGSNGIETYSKTYDFGVDYANKEVTISLDIYFIDSIDSPEAIQVFIDNSEVGSYEKNYTYSRTTTNEFWNWGSEFINTFTYTTTLDASGQVTLGFGSTLNQAIFDESFGIDNIKITLANSESTDLTIDTNEDEANITGTITSSDIDSDIGVLSYSTTSNISGFVLNSDGTYSLDLSHSDYQSLEKDEILNLTIPITVTDDYSATDTKNLVINILGTNDFPVLDFVAYIPLNEDSIYNGTVSSNDIDDSSNVTYSSYKIVNGVVIPTEVSGFTLNSDGTYTFDASHSAYQSLAKDEQKGIAIPIIATDENGFTDTQNLVFRLYGTNDTPIISASSTDIVEGESFFDNFSDDLSNWEEVSFNNLTPNHWYISSDMLYEKSDAALGFMKNTSIYSSDSINYTIKADIFSNSDTTGSSNDGVGFIFSYVDSDNYYLARWVDFTAGHSTYSGYKDFELVKVVAGVETILDKIDEIELGVNFELTVDVTSFGIDILVDGVSKLTSNETPILYSMGLYTDNNDEGISYDNISVIIDNIHTITSTNEDDTYEFDVLSQYNQIDDDISISYVQNPILLNGIEVGTATINGSNIIFTPNDELDKLSAGESESIFIEYTVSDSLGETVSSVVSFDVLGSADYVTSVDGRTSASNYLQNTDSIFAGATSFDVSMSIKSNIIATSALLSYNTTSKDNELLIFTNSSGVVHFFLGGSSVVLGSTNILDGNEHDIRLTWDSSSGTTNLYIDEVLDTTVTYKKDYVINSDNGSLVLAQEQDTYGGGFQSSQSYNGTYSDINIIVDDLLKVNWKMDTINGSTIEDISGNGNDLTINGTASLVEKIYGSGSDGYIVGATIFADTNENGIFDEGETSVITDIYGDYELVDAKGTLTLVGGVDISTNILFNTVMTAPDGSTMITPYTSIIDKMMKLDNSLSTENANSKLLNILSINEDINLLKLDTLAEYKTNNTLGLNTQKIAVILLNMNTFIELYNKENGFELLAMDILTSNNLDLTSNSWIASILDTDNIDIIETIANINQSMMDSSSLEKLTQIQIFANNIINEFTNDNVSLFTQEKIETLSSNEEIGLLTKEDISNAVEDLDIYITSYKIEGNLVEYRAGETASLNEGEFTLYENGEYDFLPYQETFVGILPQINYSTNIGVDESFTPSYLQTLFEDENYELENVITYKDNFISLELEDLLSETKSLDFLFNDTKVTNENLQIHTTNDNSNIDVEYMDISSKITTDLDSLVQVDMDI